MASSQPNRVTQLLIQWRGGSQQALDRLLPLVYEELRHLAARYMRQERSDHTLQATALVHEAYTRLVNMDVPWQDRVHFYAVAARTMRRILVEHARARGRIKRGGEWHRKTFDEQLIISPDPPVDILALDEALTRLSAQDERKARAVELHYFGGLSYQETAAALEVSPATIHRELRLAKAWLFHELSES